MQFAIVLWSLRKVMKKLFFFNMIHIEVILRVETNEVDNFVQIDILAGGVGNRNNMPFG